MHIIVKALMPHSNKLNLKIELLFPIFTSKNLTDIFIDFVMICYIEVVLHRAIFRQSIDHDRAVIFPLDVSSELMSSLE
jgi:hypothetical protein